MFFPEFSGSASGARGYFVPFLTAYQAAVNPVSGRAPVFSHEKSYCKFDLKPHKRKVRYQRL